MSIDVETEARIEDLADAPQRRAGEQATPDSAADDGLVRDDLLVEDVSIDGMCGVY